MTSRSAALGASSGQSGAVREVVFTVANISLIAFLVPLRSLVLFFAVCLLFVILRSALSGPVRTAVQVAGVVAVTLLLLYLKKSDLLFNDLVNRWMMAIVPGSASRSSTELVAALGVSYGLLRFVYALFDKAVTPWQFVRYYFFFPTFFSGPIMAPATFLLQAPAPARSDLLEGAARLMYGGVKFGFASALQLFVPLTHPVHFNLAVQTYSSWSLWLGLFLCGVWLYLNFSAFTDIAIGLGRMLGIRVPENFRNPFAATDITDFWRRWHITLGDWLRVHVFNSLTRGLSRSLSPQSLILVIVPTLATMLVCGLWHQTTWAYLAWGAMHGAGLITHQLWRRYVAPLLDAKRLGGRWYAAASWALSQGFVSLSWAFFFPLAQPGFQPTFGLHLLYLKRLLFLS